MTTWTVLSKDNFSHARKHAAFYANMVRGRRVGEGGLLTLGPEDTVDEVKRNVVRAARQADFGVRWHAAPAGQLRFQLTEVAGLATARTEQHSNVYADMMRGRQIGEGGLLTLEPGDELYEVKRNVVRAARQAGFGVNWRRALVGQLRFVLTELAHESTTKAKPSISQGIRSGEVVLTQGRSASVPARQSPHEYRMVRANGLPALLANLENEMNNWPEGASRTIELDVTNEPGETRRVVQALFRRRKYTVRWLSTINVGKPRCEAVRPLPRAKKARNRGKAAKWTRVTDDAEERVSVWTVSGGLPGSSRRH